MSANKVSKKADVMKFIAVRSTDSDDSSDDTDDELIPRQLFRHLLHDEKELGQVDPTRGNARSN